MAKKMEGWSGDFQGNDLEEAYMNIFQEGLTSEIQDKKYGLDIPTGDREIPFIQVKSSLKGVIDFLAESVRRRKFIPICLGDPGAKEEILESIKKFGGWVGLDVPNREQMLENIAKARNLCYSA